MRLAQQLYENGAITYMRTDSTSALGAGDRGGAHESSTSSTARSSSSRKPRIYKTNVKNAQEAHEAIRPAGSRFTSRSTR